ncbi:MAG: glutathione S-transferase family protein [Alcanivoracaceae bacterium]|jgi:glutathione S-transferase|nr:glutathione S-transferase family protein [Alcanivoracaceae bacterium]
MELKLYGAALSPFVRKTRIFMQEKDIPFEAIHIDPNSPPADFEKLNPLKRIPVLQHGERVLADSAVICRYLESLFPQTPLYPTDPWDQARCTWFEKFADYELGVSCTFSVFRNRVIMPLIGRPCDEDKVQKALNSTIPPLFAYLDKELAGKQFLLGEQMTIADIALASQMVNLRHGGEFVDADRYSNLAAHTERMHSRPTFASAIAKESGFVEKVRAKA